MENDFSKRVAKGVMDIIIRITKDTSDIRQFCLSLINILSKVCKTERYNIFRYESILTFLLDNGLKIPKSMKTGVDENLIRDLMCHLDNVRRDEQFNEVINNIELILRDFDKGLNLGLRDDLCYLKDGLMENMDNSTIFYGCSDIGKTLDYIAKNNKDVTILCQGNDLEKLKVLKLKTELLDLKNVTIAEGSTILKPKFVGKNKFDYAIIDLLSEIILGKEEYEEIKQMISNQKDVFILGEATQTSHAFITMQQVMYSLSENGKALFIVPSGILYKSGKDKEVREQLIRRDIIETIIVLPPRLAAKTAVSFSIIIFNKAKENINQIQLINAQNLGTIISKNRMELTSNDLKKIIDIFRSKEEETHFSQNVDIEQIAKNDYSLLIDKYVPFEEEIVKTNYFSDVEVNTEEIEKLFETKNWLPLDIIASIFKGSNILKTDDDENGKFKVLNMSALKDGEIDYSDIIRSNMERFKSYPILEKNDILISCKGEAIKIAIVDEDVENYTITQGAMVIRANRIAGAKYLELYLSSPLGRYLISKIQKGTFMPMISLKDLGTIPIIILPSEEQEEYIKEFEEQERILENEMGKILNEMKNNRKKLYKKIGIEKTYVICKEKNKKEGNYDE